MRGWQLENQSIRFLHPTRTNSFGRNAQDEPDRDIETSNREEEETRDEGELGDVVREDCSSD